MCITVLHSVYLDLNRRLVEISEYILFQHNLEPGVGLDIPSQVMQIFHIKKCACSCVVCSCLGCMCVCWSCPV